MSIPALYLVLGPNVIEEPGLYETPHTVEATLANGRVRTKLYLAEVEVKGRREPSLLN